MQKHLLKNPDKMNQKPYELDTAKMHSDIIKRLYLIKKPQRYLTEKLGVARSTMWRLGEGRDITIGTFLKLLTWLEIEQKDINKYIKR